MVDEYRDPVYPTSLSASFVAVFQEVEILLNYHVEHTVILNDITQENNKVQEDKSNGAVKFHRMERSMEKSMSTFKIVVKAEQRNGGP